MPEWAPESEPVERATKPGSEETMKQEAARQEQIWDWLLVIDESLVK